MFTICNLIISKNKINNYTKIKQQESNVKICSVLSVYENFKDQPKLTLNRAIIFISFIFLLNKAIKPHHITYLFSIFAKLFVVSHKIKTSRAGFSCLPLNDTESLFVRKHLYDNKASYQLKKTNTQNYRKN